jgi:hypothetical protein
VLLILSCAVVRTGKFTALEAGPTLRLGAGSLIGDGHYTRKKQPRRYRLARTVRSGKRIKKAIEPRRCDTPL